MPWLPMQLTLRGATDEWGRVRGDEADMTSLRASAERTLHWGRLRTLACRSSSVGCGRRRITPRRVSVAVLLAVVAGYLGFLAAGLGQQSGGVAGFVNDWMQNALTLVSAAVCTAGALRRRAGRGGWLALAAALWLWLAGQIVWTVFYGALANPPTPSGADALWFAAYPGFYACVLITARRRLGRMRSGVWLDGAIVGLAVGAVGWDLLEAPLNAIVQATPGSAATALAYPVGDLVVLATILAFLVVHRTRPDRVWLMLAAGFLLNTFADVGSVYSLAGSTDIAGGMAQGIWVVAQLLLAFAAFQPEAPASPRPDHGAVDDRGPDRTRHSRGRARGVHHRVPRARGGDRQRGRARRDHPPFAAHLPRLAPARPRAPRGRPRRRHERGEPARADRRRRDEAGRRRTARPSLDAADRCESLQAPQRHARSCRGRPMLCQFADRLREMIPEQQMIAAALPVKFAVCWDEQPGAGCAAATDRLHAALRTPFELEGFAITGSASVGAAIADADSDPHVLLRQADIAMYEAKRLGRGSRSTAQRSSVPPRAARACHRAASRAARGREISPTSSPKVDIATGITNGVEALARWNHPTRGLVSPADFLPAAERGGLTRELLHVIFAAVCRQQGLWQQQNIAVRVAINLSPQDIADDELAHWLKQAAAASGCDPAMLRLELTEQSLMLDPVRGEHVLRELAGIGFGLSLDDYGTGSSSLSRLKRAPVDELKIDPSFVRHMDSHRSTRQSCARPSSSPTTSASTLSPRASKPPRSCTPSPPWAATARRDTSSRSRCPEPTSRHGLPPRPHARTRPRGGHGRFTKSGLDHVSSSRHGKNVGLRDDSHAQPQPVEDRRRLKPV